jgi:hypothetical protein
MFIKREEKIKRTGVTLLRLLLAVTMLQYLLAGTLISRAATLAQDDSVTGFDLLQSVDKSTWDDVSGDLNNGFSMVLNPTVAFYYLDVANLEADPLVGEGYHPFVVSNTPPGWLAVWDAKGVNSSATGWQGWMYQIIIGNQPIFYLKVTESADVQSFQLIDGLLRDFFSTEEYLRVDGTYLPGDYTFTGTITDEFGTPSQLPVSITFTLVQRLLTVSKTGTGFGTVTSDPPSISCGITCKYDFDQGTVVTLTASASTGSTFAGWSGLACSGMGDCVVTMDAAETVTAEFTLDQYTLTVDKEGTGSGTVTSNPAGIACGATCADDFDYGTVVTLTTVTSAGSVFRGWSGAGCFGTGDCIVTISAAETVTATFNSQEPLTVHKDGTGSGTVTSTPAGIDCGATCTHDFDQNTVVTLTATADTGSSFTGWTGAGCSGTDKCIVTMSAAETATATFTLNQYQLSVSKTGSGTVTSNPPGIDCGATCDYDFTYNTVVTLTATPMPGWSFLGWEGDLSGNTNPVAITIDGNKSATAVFKQYYVYLPVVRRDPVFFDYFDYGDSSQALTNWEIVPETKASWFILDHQYHGKHTVVDRNAKAVAKVYPPRMPTSYSVEAKVQLAAGSDSGSRGGLLFDYLSSTQTYRFVIVPGVTIGTNWMVQKYLSSPSDHWEPIQSGLDLVHINPGTAVNLLRVERKGTEIRVYANGFLLWSGTDSSYTNGRAGFNIGTPVDLVSGEYVEVIFDDFIIDFLQ